jgi:hypothetical protein
LSATEIINELPKLTAEDQAAVRRKLHELEEQDAMLFLHESADSLFREADKQEERLGL